MSDINSSQISGKKNKHPNRVKNEDSNNSVHLHEIKIEDDIGNVRGTSMRDVPNTPFDERNGPLTANERNQ